MKTNTSVVKAKAKAKAKSSKAKAPRTSAKNDNSFRNVIGVASLIGAGIGAVLGATFA